jgi:hypothetical protein
MSESIIIVLQGGLGNQLFQYAAGLTLASRLGGELWLTPTQENKHSGKDYRGTLYRRGKAIGPDGKPVAGAHMAFGCPENEHQEPVPTHEHLAPRHP